VETALDGIGNIAESAVIGVPHPDFGEAVVAVVELADPGAELAVGVVQGELAERLAKYKIPKAIQILPQLPRNTLGKVQKAMLKARFADLFTWPT
jgi:malonyl-CoA/methylmalonyl-CoA synthetase